MTQTVCEIGESRIDENIRIIESVVSVEITPHGNTFIIRGNESNVSKAEELIYSIAAYLDDKKSDFELDEHDIRYLAEIINAKDRIKVDDVSRLKIVIPDSGKTIVPKSLNQAVYISEIMKHPIVFGVGPAGTGKTYLAVASALKYLGEGKVSRIVLTRPAVEAGENLGFLPGSLIEKINPYLRPLYDALFECLPFEKVSKMIETNMIEIAPLAYMRGRTLANAFIILDEAQNTSISQMKMILTRLGANSTIVVSGDPSQIDIDKPAQSGILHAMKILKDIPEVRIVQFNRSDICRHPVVQKIVDAYEKGQSY
jgi:phosphate starvation-inducible PhoH-like protein